MYHDRQREINCGCIKAVGVPGNQKTELESGHRRVLVATGSSDRLGPSTQFCEVGICQDSRLKSKPKRHAEPVLFSGSADTSTLSLVFVVQNIATHA